MIYQNIIFRECFHIPIFKQSTTTSIIFHLTSTKKLS